MAIAVKTELPPVETPPYQVTLTLTQREAEVLAKVFHHIGGHPDTARGVIEEIKDALYRAGVRMAKDEIHPFQHSLWFAGGPEVSE